MNSRWKYLFGFLVGVVIAAAIDVASANAMQPQPKVVVCKYVGQPGVDERLQTGQNPIVVNGNALPGWDGVTFPFEFADAQGKSVAIRIAVDSHDGDISECPAPIGPPPCEVDCGPPPCEVDCEPPPCTENCEPPPVIDPPHHHGQPPDNTPKHHPKPQIKVSNDLPYTGAWYWWIVAIPGIVALSLGLAAKVKRG